MLDAVIIYFSLTWNVHQPCLLCHYVVHNVGQSHAIFARQNLFVVSFLKICVIPTEIRPKYQLDAVLFYKNRWTQRITLNKDSTSCNLNNDNSNVIKSTKMTWNQNTEQTENTACTDKRITSFPKKPVENADLRKPVLNKIMTTRGYLKNLLWVSVRGIFFELFMQHCLVSVNTKIMALVAFSHILFTFWIMLCCFAMDKILNRPPKVISKI